MKKFFLLLALFVVFCVPAFADTELTAGNGVNVTKSGAGAPTILTIDEAEAEATLELQDLQGAVTDAQVPDTITASNYLPLAGGTLTGQVVTDNLGVEFDESDTNPTCSSGNFNIYADLSENKLKKCQNGTASDLDTTGGGGGTPGGSDTHVQFNDGGSFGGEAGFVYNKTTDSATLVGSVTAASFVSSSTSAGTLTLSEASANGSNFVAISAASSLSGNTTYTFPTADGSSGQFLKTNGSGTLSWDSPAGSGDVASVGDCSSGDCLDGTSDGGTYVRIYDGNSHYTAVVSSNVSANTTITLPANTGTVIATGDSGTVSTAMVASGVTLDTEWDTAAEINSATTDNDFVLDTAAIDWGGKTSLEVPNSATPTTDAAGEIALDTTITDHQPFLQYYDGSKNMTVIAIDTSELPATDNEIIKYDAATDKFVLEADATGGGGGGGATMIELRPSQALVASSLVTASVSGADTATQTASIENGERLLFDETTDEAAIFKFVMPNNYSSAPVLKIMYRSTATSGTVEFEGAIQCDSSGDSADPDTASFAAAAIVSETVPGTAGYPKTVSITLTDDSCAARDMAKIYLSTDANDGTNDSASGDRKVELVWLEYTGS